MLSGEGKGYQNVPTMWPHRSPNQVEKEGVMASVCGNQGFVMFLTFTFFFPNFLQAYPTFAMWEGEQPVMNTDCFDLFWNGLLPCQGRLLPVLLLSAFQPYRYCSCTRLSFACCWVVPALTLQLYNCLSPFYQSLEAVRNRGLFSVVVISPLCFYLVRKPLEIKRHNSL